MDCIKVTDVKTKRPYKSVENNESLPKDILIVVDYQNDFVDGALGFESAKDIEPGIFELVKKYLEKENGYVIYTFDTHEDNYLDTQEGKKLPVPHCIWGTNGHQLYGRLGDDCMQPLDKTVCITKETFGSHELYRRLSAYNNGQNGNSVRSITLCGVVTNMCVISNAVIAKTACPEAEIIVRSDLCDSFDKELHQKALDVMASMQMTVTDKE